MTGRRAVWLALAGLVISAPAWAAVPASEAARVAISSCTRKLNPDIDVGYQRIAARCPDLARRLQESGWSPWLPRDWKRAGNDLTAGGLRQLGDLLALQERDEAGSGAHISRPRTDHLPAVLAGLEGGGAAERNGWWARTKAWLREAFERNEEEDDDWFARVVGKNGLPQAVVELASYAALALVVVLAGMVVVNELRVGGALGRLRRRFNGLRPGGRQVDAERVGDDGGLNWGEVQGAAPAQRPGLLLELITSRLTAEGRLPQSRGLTIRELTRAARLTGEGDWERLAELARVSELMRFSNDQASSEAVAAAVEGGRVLLERISP
jgi:hypothetical protein